MISARKRNRQINQDAAHKRITDSLRSHYIAVTSLITHPASLTISSPPFEFLQARSMPFHHFVLSSLHAFVDSSSMESPFPTPSIFNPQHYLIFYPSTVDTAELSLFGLSLRPFNLSDCSCLYFKRVTQKMSYIGA